MSRKRKENEIFSSNLSLLAKELDCLLHKNQKNIIIAIDGDSGSGKTTLGKQLQKQYSANLIHIDDFYLPKVLRTPERFAYHGGNIHIERIIELLEHIQEGNDLLYAPYNRLTDQIERAKSYPPTTLTIVEGSYSQLPMLDPFYDFKIFLKLDKSEQLERIENREGTERFQDFIKQWIPREKNYQEDYQIENHASIIIETSKLNQTGVKK